jgi:coenzyme PQQ synthesis protein D (PqqD)
MAVEKNKYKLARGSHGSNALRFYDSAFVLNAASGMFYRLSPAADYLLRALDAGAQPGQFAELVMSRYGADRATAVRDTELLLNQFAALGLLDAPEPKRKADT